MLVSVVALVFAVLTVEACEYNGRTYRHGETWIVTPSTHSDSFFDRNPIGSGASASGIHSGGIGSGASASGSHSGGIGSGASVASGTRSPPSSWIMKCEMPSHNEWKTYLAGCVTPRGAQVMVGSWHTEDDFQFECVKDHHSGMLELKSTRVAV